MLLSTDLGHPSPPCLLSRAFTVGVHSPQHFVPCITCYLPFRFPFRFGHLRLSALGDSLRCPSLFHSAISAPGVLPNTPACGKSFSSKTSCTQLCDGSLVMDWALSSIAFRLPTGEKYLKTPIVQRSMFLPRSPQALKALFRASPYPVALSGFRPSAPPVSFSLRLGFPPAHALRMSVMSCFHDQGFWSRAG